MITTPITVIVIMISNTVKPPSEGGASSVGIGETRRPAWVMAGFPGVRGGAEASSGLDATRTARGRYRHKWARF